MGLMQRFIFKFSVFASIAAFIGALLNGVSVLTSVMRAGLVMFGTLVLFIVLMNVLRWAIISTTVIEMHDHDEKEKTHDREIEKINENAVKTAKHLTDNTE